MQETTKQELREITALMRQVLMDFPPARKDDNVLYYKVCKEWAAENGIDINTVHFTTVFLGNPYGFPKYESVVRLRRMVQRKEPGLADEKAAELRQWKEADMVAYARNMGVIV